MIRVTLPGTPPSNNNLYFNVAHGRVMSAKGKDMKTEYQWEIKRQYKHKPLKDAVTVIIDLYFKQERKRDVDNYNKLLLDSGTGLLWEDDSQIWELTIRKWVDKDNPRVELIVM